MSEIKNTDEIKEFVDQSIKSLPLSYQSKAYDVWNFGELTQKLLPLVLSGKKVATAGMLIDESLVSKVGDLGVITDEQGLPQCLIEYTNIEIKPFLEVEWEFAKQEGEGYSNIKEWRDAHRNIYAKWHPDVFTDDSLIVCSSFKLIYP